MAMLAKHRATSTTRSSMGWNHRVGTHQIPPDSISNSGLDQRIGTAAAHAVRNVPVAKTEERVGAVGWNARGPSSTVLSWWPCARTGAWWASPRSRRCWRRRRTPCWLTLWTVIRLWWPQVRIRSGRHGWRRSGRNLDWLWSRNTATSKASSLPTGWLASCSGSTTRISTGSADSWPQLLTPEPPARKQCADACGTGCPGWPSAARRDGLGRPAGWHRGPNGQQPRRRLLHPRNRVPGRRGRHPNRDLGDPRPICGRRDRPHRPPRGAHRPARRLPPCGRHAAADQLAVERSRARCRGVGIGAGRQHHCHAGRHGPPLVAASPRPRPGVRGRTAGHRYPRPAVHRDLPGRGDCVVVTRPDSNGALRVAALVEIGGRLCGRPPARASLIRDTIGDTQSDAADPLPAPKPVRPPTTKHLAFRPWSLIPYPLRVFA